MGDKKTDGSKLFESFSLGVATARDAWCFNHSQNEVAANISRMIESYNSERVRFDEANIGLSRKDLGSSIDRFINLDPKKISWTRALKQELAKGGELNFQPGCVVSSLYRPFTRQFLYFNRQMNDMVNQMPKIFPGV